MPSVILDERGQVVIRISTSETTPGLPPGWRQVYEDSATGRPVMDMPPISEGPRATPERAREPSARGRRPPNVPSQAVWNNDRGLWMAPGSAVGWAPDGVPIALGGAQPAADPAAAPSAVAPTEKLRTSVGTAPPAAAPARTETKRGTGVGAAPPAAAPARTETKRGTGVTIGDDEDYRAAAQQALHNLGVVNADPYISDDLVDRLALSKADTRAIIQTFRTMQSLTVSGITLGQELDYRQAAQSTLSGLGVFREATVDEIRRFAQGRADPGVIARYYRDTERGPLGIGLGAEQDYRALAKRTLEQLGLTRDPTATEITAFARGNLDPEGIQRAYATSPEVLGINPGAQYGLSREEYRRERAEVERAAAYTSGVPESGGMTAESEPGYLREAFAERMAPAEVEAGLEDVQRRLGTPPTAEDVKRIRTRQRVKTAEDRAGPAGRRTAIGPTVGLEPPERHYVGPRRA